MTAGDFFDDGVDALPRADDAADTSEALADDAADAPGMLAGIEEVEEFCESLRYERNVSMHTQRNYRCDLMDYLRWADRIGLDPLKVSHKQMRRYLGELDQAQYARTTISRHLSVLHSFFRWLNATGRIADNPASVLQGPKKHKRLPKVMTAADLARLFSVRAEVDRAGKPREQSHTDMRDLALLELLYACGIRVGEASGLKTRDIDWDRRQVKVFGKGSKERIVPVHEIALQSMDQYAKRARPHLLKGKRCEFFFVSIRGNPMSTDAIRKVFKAALAEAGLDQSLSPHALRHTFATDMLEGGADLRSVQEMLGHVSMSTTQIYTHISPEHLRNVHHQAHPRG